jgi:hypothetical protein
VTQMRDTGRLKDEELRTARAASDANRKRAVEATDALAGVMLRLLDQDETCDRLRDTPEWKAAAHILGWDVDWAELAAGPKPCTCTIACIPQGITDDQVCRLR